jgi:uncharacterized protein YceH (UPF0502 family)
MGCTRVVERVCASLGGGQSAPARFAPALDVAQAGVLWALPALLANGLLRHLDEFFQLKKGYYSLRQIFILLAFMALCRIKAVERLRYNPPGEWGKLLGLDRIPEVRTLRLKLEELSQGEVGPWSAQLSQEWLEGEPEAAGLLYVDGRVSVYHGHQTQLPRRYVSRERLCLRGLTDYWVNDRLGRPFFVVSTPFSDGIVAMLREQIVPRLLREVPGQPDAAALAENPLAHRFVLIFDREGYSPEFFRELWEQRIACQTYRKGSIEPWPEAEFSEREVPGAGGEAVRLRLAERPTRLSNGFAMREVRRLSQAGHQTAVLSSDYLSSAASIALHMFSRWSQENFFKYMDEHFDLDRLASYATALADETRKVVNPLWRALATQLKSKAAVLGRRQAEYAQICLGEEDLDHRRMERFAARKGELREVIAALEQEVAELKQRKGATQHKIELGKLSQEDRFRLIAPGHKGLLDTIKMIAYRAETAMALLAREGLARKDDTRALLREIYGAPADLLVDEAQGTLTISLHHLSNALSDQAARRLAEHLNQTETLYPGTNLRLCFKLVSDLFPGDQEI